MDVLPKATSTDPTTQRAQMAVLPIGSFEQHGAHLPLATDTIVACAIAEAVAARYDLLLLPPLTFACSQEHAGFAGTVSVGAGTLHQLISDISRSLDQQGVRHLALVNAHGGNYALGNVVQEANVCERRMILFPHRDDWEHARKAGGLATSNHDDMHGGELETSVLLRVAPDQVRPGIEDDDWIASERTHLHIIGVAGYSSSGIIGRPSLATAEKGRLVLQDLAASFESHLRQLDH